MTLAPEAERNDSPSITPQRESWRTLVAESGVVILGTSAALPFKSHHDSGSVFSALLHTSVAHNSVPQMCTTTMDDMCMTKVYNEGAQQRCTTVYMYNKDVKQQRCCTPYDMCATNVSDGVQ